MQPRSALTAAFKSGGATEPCGPPQNALDAASFPCVSDASPATISDLSAGLDRVDLQRTHLAGSAPTARTLPGQATVDYELNPFSLRSGREIVPPSLRPSSVASNFLSEAVLGSLPRALSVAERERVLASVPLSPTLNLLSSMPSDKVSSRSVEGRRLRRHVMRGAVLVFITAGYSGKRFIFEKAKELGVRTVVIDGPDSWSQMMVKEGVIEKFIGLDMSDAETVFDRCLAAILRVKKEIGDLDGVVSFSEMAMPLVARLAEKLGLPGNPPSAVDQARDKHQTREVMAAAGLPTPRNFLITDPNELEKAANLVGFPAVIKPIYGAASIGVVRVNDLPGLKQSYARVVKEMAGARIVAGALQQGSDEEEESVSGADKPKADGNAASWIRTTIMIEEYLDGPEVDVDLVFSDGQPVYGAVTDNWPTLEPYFNETGSNSPSILPSYQQRELLELAVCSVQSLGFLQGVFHVECKYTSRGARLIEVNCRMGGGPVHTMNRLVWGVDLAEEQLLCTAGIPSRPPVAAKPLASIAEFSVNAMRTGLLRNVDFLERYQGDADVLYARALVEPGSKVVCVSDGLPTWVCELMVQKPTVDEAIAFVKTMEEQIQQAMPIDPLPPKK